VGVVMNNVYDSDEVMTSGCGPRPSGRSSPSCS